MGAFLSTLRQAFAVEPEIRLASGELPPALSRLAGAIVERGMETPAIVLLESLVPLSFLCNQAMLACWPLVKLAAVGDDYRQVAEALEDRRTLRRLVRRIEELAARDRGVE